MLNSTDVWKLLIGSFERSSIQLCVCDACRPELRLVEWQTEVCWWWHSLRKKPPSLCSCCACCWDVCSEIIDHQNWNSFFTSLPSVNMWFVVWKERKPVYFWMSDCTGLWCFTCFINEKRTCLKKLLFSLRAVTKASSQSGGSLSDMHYWGSTMTWTLRETRRTTLRSQVWKTNAPFVLAVVKADPTKTRGDGPVQTWHENMSPDWISVTCSESHWASAWLQADRSSYGFSSTWPGNWTNLYIHRNRQTYWCLRDAAGLLTVWEKRFCCS